MDENHPNEDNIKKLQEIITNLWEPAGSIEESDELLSTEDVVRMLRTVFNYEPYEQEVYELMLQLNFKYNSVPGNKIAWLLKNKNAG